MSPTIKDYAVQIYWDDRAGYFVAEIPEIPTCAADGSTQTEALANLEETFAVLKETYQEEGLAFPPPNPELPVSVAHLSAAAPLVKVSKVAELAGIPVQTLSTKVKRGTEFSVGESRKIARALHDYGVSISMASVFRVPHHGGKSSVEKVASEFRTWTRREVGKLRQLAEQNTPLRVIGMKLGRSDQAIYKAASESGISLKPTNQSPYSQRRR